MDWLPGLSLAALDEYVCWWAQSVLADRAQTKQGHVPLVMVGPVAVVPNGRAKVSVWV